MDTANYCSVIKTPSTVISRTTIMAQEAQQTLGKDEQITVETNNFHRVLEHFDEDGYLIDPVNIHLELTCQICNEKNLALINNRFDRRTRETHECYTVLPRCGHAFGYRCLYSWLLSDASGNRTCPTCRKPVYLSRAHRNSLLEIFGDAGIQEQNKEVVDIRKVLREGEQQAASVLPTPQQDGNVVYEYVIEDDVDEDDADEDDADEDDTDEDAPIPPQWQLALIGLQVMQRVDEMTTRELRGELVAPENEERSPVNIRIPLEPTERNITVSDMLANDDLLRMADRWVPRRRPRWVPRHSRSRSTERDSEQ
ncbi:hypothetical protein F4779DRAFT_490086 [Xylariaceae sp. FL0662B]|nr:hypothetical protein F4779DRAFT_490086 [Xylariaceae sp. FL0662B]